jgi:hypothetical protein
MYLKKSLDRIWGRGNNAIDRGNNMYAKFNYSNSIPVFNGCASFLRNWIELKLGLNTALEIPLDTLQKCVRFQLYS